MYSFYCFINVFDWLQDLPGFVRRVANFLGKSLLPDELERLCGHLSFENFKNYKSVNQEDLRKHGMLDNNETFIRKGKIYR